MTEKKNIKTMNDVLRYFGVEYLVRDDMKTKNAKLSHRIYKDTSCGAWASVDEEAMLRKEEWRARYARTKKDGWHVKAVAKVKSGTKKIAKPAWIPLDKAHEFVRDFFWPPFFEDRTHAHQELCAIFGDKKTSATYDASVNVPFKKRLVFRCGSSVEGVSEEALAFPVTLPCTERDIDDAVRFVELEADEIWNRTHGCEGCVKAWNAEGRKAAREKDYFFTPYVYEVGNTAVHPKCKSCKGHGEII